MVPPLQTSIPNRFLNPENPNTEREIADIEEDNILVKESDLITTTENLSINVSSELLEIDQIIDKMIKRTVGNSSQKLLEKNYLKVRID